MNENTCEEKELWRSCPPGDIVWIGWGPDHIAYHRPSGQTHFLNASSWRLITLLHEPTGVAGILATLSLAVDETEGSTRIDELQSVLERFEQLGLIERL